MRNPKLLLVDDEISFTANLSKLLSRRGYELSVANDGENALRMVQEQEFDVILLDIRMPGMEGREVLSRIKALDPDVEVIIMTGHGDMEMAVECFLKDASNFLSKPFSVESLTVSLKRSLDKVALKRKLKQYKQNLETLMREAHSELEWAYRFRDNLIENSHDPIVSTNKNGIIVIFNSAAEKLLGYKKEEVIGKMNLEDIYSVGEARRVMNDLMSGDFGGPGTLRARKTALLDKNSVEIPLLLSASILYQNGQEAGSVSIFTDIREKEGPVLPQP